MIYTIYFMIQYGFIWFHMLQVKSLWYLAMGAMPSQHAWQRCRRCWVTWGMVWRIHLEPGAWSTSRGKMELRSLTNMKAPWRTQVTQPYKNIWEQRKDSDSFRRFWASLWRCGKSFGGTSILSRWYGGPGLVFGARALDLVADGSLEFLFGLSLSCTKEFLAGTIASFSQLRNL